MSVHEDRKGRFRPVPASALVSTRLSQSCPVRCGAVRVFEMVQIAHSSCVLVFIYAALELWWEALEAGHRVSDLVAFIYQS